MESILICEGSTDYSLLQYYMRVAHQWNDDSMKQNEVLKIRGQKSRKLVRGNDALTIMSAGGCSRLCEALENVLNRNRLSEPDLSGAYNKIAIVTDRDEFDTEGQFLSKVEETLSRFDVIHTDVLANNTWLSCKMINATGRQLEFQLLLMIVPFEENGAMETFLLKAIGENDAYDKFIIEECEDLVDRVDPEKKYLTGRRIITKAKFDTYFSIRTPAEQFNERQNILRNVKWEQYTRIQSDFRLLGEL